MVYSEVIIRSYNIQNDRALVEDLERRCEVGPSQRVILSIDTLGDPMCRIKNSRIYNMLVAELGNELVGVIQGTIKLAKVDKPQNNCCNKQELSKLGYVLGLRVAPLQRRKGIGLRLVRELEEWFVANDVDYAYMATEKSNMASVSLFMNKLGYSKFVTPSILVNPVQSRDLCQPSTFVKIIKLGIEEADNLYRTFMSSCQMFPDDIGQILKNKLSLGTWVAYYSRRDQPYCKGYFRSSNNWKVPSSWAMVSVWNSGELFKLRLEKAPLSCLLFMKGSNLFDKMFPCFPSHTMPDLSHPFGFYFMYGLYHQGSKSGKLVKSLCNFVHNMALESSKDCKVVVTEVGGFNDALRVQIPHKKSLSCPEDLWCIKPLKNKKDDKNHNNLYGLFMTENTSPTMESTKALFVDPREF